MHFADMQWRWSWPLALVGFAGAAFAPACADRQTEVDHLPYIVETCELTCPVTVECDDDSYYDDVETCIETCSDPSNWEDLDQCDSAMITLSRCISDLSCAEYQDYLDRLDEDDSYKEGVPCLDELVSGSWCDPAQPYDSMEDQE